MRITRVIAAAIALALATIPAATATAQDLPVVNIGIAIDGPWERNKEVGDLFQQEILALAEGELDVRFPPDKTIVGDWTIEGAARAVDALLADREVDLVIALGILVSQNICMRGDLPKPSIAPTVLDAIVQQLPGANGASGVRNLNYLVIPHSIARDVQAFLEVVPFTRLALFLSAATAEAIPGKGEGFRGVLEEFGVRASIHPVGDTIAPLLASLPADVEAVYVAPMLQLAPGEFDVLVDALIERKLPSFALLGPSEVERGILASLNTDLFPRLARRVALNVQRMLLGEDAGELPTAFSVGARLTINMATARAIDAYPTWAVLTDAVLINDVRSDIERRLTLRGAIEEALEANLDLAVRARSLAASAQDMNLARATLLPQVDLSLTGLQIDEERAERSFGQTAERTISGSISLEQIVFSEPAWANRSIQRHLQNSREYEREVLTLDILQSAATSYLSLLRAKATERIQKNNLARTRSNLELARMREALGTARAAEVLRWESELANNRKSVIDANSRRNIAEISLNRLLHRPTEEDFLTEEVELNDPQLLMPLDRITLYMNNPWDFKVFRRFMVMEGLRSTPEIMALNEAISAQERAAGSASRAFWLPRVGLFGELDNVFSREGAGSEPSGVFTEPEDLSWQVGVSLTYPLFAGGAKFHERSQAIESAGELRIELASVSEKVEQRIRSALHAAGASYAGMGQAQIASDAAARSLDLVEDAYSKGAATILDVLDAQNNARVAEEAAADAIYEFLIDMVEAERSIGRIIMQMTDTDRAAFFERLDDYFEQNRK